MTDKDQHIHQTSQANGHTKHDEETAVLHSKDARKNKRMKCLLYIAIFIVFQTAIILLFALTIMKIRTPKFRVRSVTFDTFDYTNTSFNISMNAELGVKNTNFGHYKFQDSTIEFFYNDLSVGMASVPKARVRARSTKEFNVIVNLSSSNVQNSPQLGSDPYPAVLTLTSKSKLNGKVELLKVLKKKKSTEMDCTLEINVRLKSIGYFTCK